jgi:hypothetical protein
MATSSASSSDGSSGQKAEQTPEPQLLGAIVAALILFAAILTIIAIIWGWRILRSDFVRIVALAGFSSLAVMSARIWLSFKKQSIDREKAIDLIGMGAVCLCATVVSVSVLAAPKMAEHLGPTAAIVWMTPENPARGIPAIACPQTISGTGSVPNGYSVVIGYQFPRSPVWTFVNSVTWQGRNHWRSGPVYMAQYPGSGRLVDLIAIVVSKSMADYYINVTKQQSTEQQLMHGPITYWDSAGLPPSIISKTPVHYATLPQLSSKRLYCWLSSRYG